MAKNPHCAPPPPPQVTVWHGYPPPPPWTDGWIFSAQIINFTDLGVLSERKRMPMPKTTSVLRSWMGKGGEVIFPNRSSILPKRSEVSQSEVSHILPASVNYIIWLSSRRNISQNIELFLEDKIWPLFTPTCRPDSHLKVHNFKKFRRFSLGDF
jgi:hypothetical protein